MDNNLNSLDFWYPILQKNNIPVPKTKIIKTNCELIYLMDGEEPKGYNNFINQITKVTDGIGYPCFIRTGYTSAKHYWKDTCYLEKKEDLGSHIYQLVEFSEIADMFGNLKYDVWCVRELLPTKPLFTAFQDMPITREFRGFWIDGEVRCVHPYWPIDTIRRPSVDNWEELLLKSHKMEWNEIIKIMKLIESVGKLFKGDWSIDLLETKKGWYVIDMAIAEQSYHWPECQYSKD